MARDGFAKRSLAGLARTDGVLSPAVAFARAGAIVARGRSSFGPDAIRRVGVSEARKKCHLRIGSGI